MKELVVVCGSMNLTRENIYLLADLSSLSFEFLILKNFGYSMNFEFSIILI